MAEDRALTYGGYCRRCERIHVLPSQTAMAAAGDLLAGLESNHLLSASAIAPLFGAARGKMFGVMLARNGDGKQLVIKAFSGQLNGAWQVKGWVPPVFAVADFDAINIPAEKQVKDLGRQIKKSACLEEQQDLIIARRERSRALMKNIHNLYLLGNFRGQQRLVSSFFHARKGVPTGAGDCCAPKLINYARQHKLTPLAMAEFYFGRENRSKTKLHGRFYPPCQSGCAPILGFMLCGLDVSDQQTPPSGEITLIL